MLLPDFTLFFLSQKAGSAKGKKVRIRANSKTDFSRSFLLQELISEAKLSTPTKASSPKASSPKASPNKLSANKDSTSKVRLTFCFPQTRNLIFLVLFFCRNCFLLQPRLQPPNRLKPNLLHPKRRERAKPKPRFDCVLSSCRCFAQSLFCFAERQTCTFGTSCT